MSENIPRTLEQELRTLGVVFEPVVQDDPPDLIAHRLHMAKGYFNDPRDPITGKLPF